MPSAAPLPAEDPALPAEAPTAPTEEAWTRMTPAEREQAVESLLASESLEEIEEREAMAEGDPHLDAKMDIRNTLRGHFGKLGRRIYVGADIAVYYPGRKGFTPDIIAVTEVEPHGRDCWMVSQEGKGVDLALEVHYKGDRRKDFVVNVEKFAALGIREYFVYDIRRRLLKGYRLPRAGAEYEPIPLRWRRLRSQVLDLDLTLEEGGHVRFYSGGAVLVTDAELAGRLEHMVDEAVARAEEQQARAEQAAMQLGSALLTILTIRGVEVGPDARERILGVTDVAILERWLGRAPAVAACDELFAEP
jgi:Uma2 family endonuclease